MDSVLALTFESRFLRQFDLRMIAENRNVALLVDNFSAHYVDFTPRNVELIFFEPNLTSFVQPMDAGVIRCLKAHYRRELCLRALDLDEAGEADIYKLDLLEAIMILQRAWDSVSQETIKHCWDHTKIRE
jgi:hypothetical protein